MKTKLLSDSKMPTRTSRLTASIIIVTAFMGGISGDVMTVAPDVTVEFTCSGPVSVIQPTWFLNGTFVETEGNCYRSRLRRLRELNATATLTISGNNGACDNFKIYCRIFRDSQFLYLHNTTLTVQGQLPAPENVLINESVNSATIEWKPPYSSMNSDTIQVDPHITQYTVYITDIYTGNIFKRNVTETQFTFNASDDGTCPMYQVTGWNAGGEGALSEPVQECRPRIPRKIAGQNVTLTVGSQQRLHIYLHVSEPCKTRTPEYFVITVMNSGGRINATTAEYDQQPRLHSTIDLPRNVDMCSVCVNISAGNSAGMSPPTKIKVECTTSVNNSDSIPTTSTRAETTPPVVIDETQEDKTPTIVALSVGAAIIVVIVAVGIGVFIYWKCKRKVKVKNSENIYTSSPTLGGHPPSTVTDGVEGDIEQNTQAYSESPSISECSSSERATESDESGALLLPASMPTGVLPMHAATSTGGLTVPLQPPSEVTEGSPHTVVYAQVDTVKQNDPQPPTNDDPVQYAQIEHQDKI